MSKEDNNTPEEDNVIDLGTNAVFEVTYKTIKCADGKTFHIAHREIVEPELPARKKPFKRGRGRPKKEKPVVVENKKSMDDDESIDMGKLMEDAIKAVE